MMGNVWEWTLSPWMEPRRLKRGEERMIRDEFEALDPDNLTLVVRGGSFVDSLEGEFNQPVRISTR